MHQAAHDHQDKRTYLLPALCNGTALLPGDKLIAQAVYTRARWRMAITASRRLPPDVILGMRSARVGWSSAEKATMQTMRPATHRHFRTSRIDPFRHHRRHAAAREQSTDTTHERLLCTHVITIARPAQFGHSHQAIACAVAKYHLRHCPCCQRATVLTPCARPSTGVPPVACTHWGQMAQLRTCTRGPRT